MEVENKTWWMVSRHLCPMILNGLKFSIKLDNVQNNWNKQRGSENLHYEKINAVYFTVPSLVLNPQKAKAQKAQVGQKTNGMIYYCLELFEASSGCSLALHPCENSQRLNPAARRQIQRSGSTLAQIGCLLSSFDAFCDFLFFFQILSERACRHSWQSSSTCKWNFSLGLTRAVGLKQRPLQTGLSEQDQQHRGVLRFNSQWRRVECQGVLFMCPHLLSWCRKSIWSFPKVNIWQIRDTFIGNNSGFR